MSGNAAADTERGTVIWRVGDPWRNLRPEILDHGTVTFVTENENENENESTTILAVADGHLVRLRGRRSGRLLGDEAPIPLTGVLVAAPCGLVLALHSVTRLRSRAVSCSFSQVRCPTGGACRCSPRACTIALPMCPMSSAIRPNRAARGIASGSIRPCHVTSCRCHVRRHRASIAVFCTVLGVDELSGGSRICVISDDGQPSDLRSAIADRAWELSEMDAAALLEVLDGSADTRWVLLATDVPVNRT